MTEAERAGGEETIRLTLFVAANSYASTVAAENLQNAVRRHDPGAFAVEIVDVFVVPRRLLRDGILVTPTLVAQDLGQRVVGDLSNASLLEYFLQSLLKIRSERNVPGDDDRRADRVTP